MSALPIVCDNCGAKYRLPESFSGDQAKCKACGSVIDVARQRAPAPAAPARTPPGARKAEAKTEPVSARRAAATPAAAAKPAVAPKPARAERASRSERGAGAADAPRGRRSRGGDDGDKPGRGRRERGDDEGKKGGNSMLLIGGGVGVLAVVAVVAVLMMNNQDDKAGSGDTAANTPAVAGKEGAPANASGTTGDPAKPAEAASKPEQGGAAKAGANAPAAGSTGGEAATDPKPADPAAADPAKPAEEPGKSPEPAEPAGDLPTAPAEARWAKSSVRSMGEVFDPTTVGEIQWPADATDEIKAQVRELVQDVIGGGRAGIKAKPELEKIGYHALFGIVEALRTLDYKTIEGNMTGYELNKVLDSIAAGINAGFNTVEASEELDPRKADYNAKTVKAWARFLEQHPTKESFETWRKERLKKADK